MNDEFQNRIDTAKAEIMAKVEDTQERQSTIIEAVVLSGAEEHKSAICTMQDSIDTLQKEMKMFHDAQNNISSRVEVMEKIILGPMPRNAKSPQDKDASSEPSGMHNPGALPSPIRKIDHTLIATRMHGTATQQHSVDLVKFDRDLGNTSETCSGQAKNMSALWEALSELELLRAEMHKVVRLQDTLKCDQETSHIALRNLRRNQPSITSRLTAIGHAQDILTTNFKDYAGYISTSLENSKLHTNHLHTELSAQQDRDKTDRASLHQRMDMLDKRLDKFEQRNRDAARLQLQLLVSHVPQACPPEPQPTARTRRETTSCPLPTPLLPDRVRRSSCVAWGAHTRPRPTERTNATTAAASIPKPTAPVSQPAATATCTEARASTTPLSPGHKSFSDPWTTAPKPPPAAAPVPRQFRAAACAAQCACYRSWTISQIYTALAISLIYSRERV